MPWQDICPFDAHGFLDTFTNVAAFSSEAGSSKKLIQEVLDGLSMTHLVDLETTLISRVSCMKSAFLAVLHMRVMNVLEWVHEVRVALSLQDKYIQEGKNATEIVRMFNEKFESRIGYGCSLQTDIVYVQKSSCATAQKISSETRNSQSWV